MGSKGYNIYISSNSPKKPAILSTNGGKSLLVRQAEKRDAELQKTFSFKSTKFNQKPVAPAGEEKSPLDTPANTRLLGNIWDKAKAYEKQGKSADAALKHATKDALDQAEKEREKAINDIMKKYKCNRHDAEVKYMQKQGLSKEEAESAVSKREKTKNSKDKANNPSYDPMTSLGYGYRQVMRYLQVAKQYGFVLVKLDSKTRDLAQKYNLEIAEGYVKIPRDILEKAAKEVEKRDNIDRRTFEKEMACDKCGHHHHGAIKNGKETK